MSLPANYDDEFNYTLGTDDDGNVIDTTQPPDDTDTTTTYTPEGGDALTSEQEWAKGWGGLNADGSINWDKFSKDDPFKLGTVSGDSPAVDPSSISYLAKSLPEQAWNAIKGAFTKKTPKLGADGKPIPNEFDESVDWKALAAAGGGIAGLATNLMNKNNPPPITGYQGKIPTLNAVQQQVPGTYDPTRRPGSSGQRYLTNMAYADPTAAAAAQTAAGEQATGLAGLNAANPAMQKRPVATPPAPAAPTTATVAPASSVIDRLAPTAKGLESLVNPPTKTPSLRIDEPQAPPDPRWREKQDAIDKPDKYPEFAPTQTPMPQGERVTYDPNDTRPIYPGPDKTGLTGGPAQPNGGWRGSDIPFTRPYVEEESTLESLESQYTNPVRTPPPQQPQIIDYKASGGGITALKGGNYLSGPTDGMADKLPANIEGNQEARLSHGEFVIPADVVSHLGNGNSDAGAERLYSMMDKIRKARTGTKKQGKQINPNKFLPGGSVGYAGGGGIKHFVVGGVTGTGTGTTTANPAVTGTESNLSNWAGPYVTDMLGKGQALANAPYQGYGGPLTAGESAGQTAAFQGAAGLNVPTGQMGAFTPQTFTADQAQNYMNPYLSAALNPQMEEMRRQSQLNLQPNMAKLTQAGGYGGSRQALMNSEANRNLLQEQNKTLGQGYQTAFDKAMGQFNTEQNRGLEAQSATNAYGLQALSKQAELGGQQRDIEQQGITADRAQFEEEKQDPYKKLTFQQSLLQGLPVQAQSNNYAQPSLLNSLAGGATTIAQLYDILFPQATTTTAPGTTPTTTAVKV